MQCDIDPGINRIKMIRMVENILKEDPLVELIFFGEVILSWYNPGKRPELHQQTAETIPGDTTQAFCSAGSKTRNLLCFGMSEKSDQDIYNTQVLINPRGEVQATHRKRRLKESTYQSGKQMFTLTEIKGIKTAAADLCGCRRS